MFETKRKIETKARFQNPYFRSKLETARGYKRQIKKIPETKMGIFLARFGLNSFLSKTAVFTVLIALIYLAFSPNFLSIKTVEITGVENEAKESIRQTVNQYFASRPLWPQSNLALLSKNGLKGFLIAKNNSVNKVIKIEKDFPSALRLEVAERFNKFVLSTEGKIYSVSNDGFVQKQLSLEEFNSSTSPYSNLLPIQLKENKIYYEKQKLAGDWFFENLNEALSLVSGEGIQISISKIFLESFERQDLEAQTSLGFTLKFDLTSDLSKVFKQLSLLLKEVGETRMGGVKYIDIRIKDRGYVCYKDAQCAWETVIIPRATSAPEIIE